MDVKEGEDLGHNDDLMRKTVLFEVLKMQQRQRRIKIMRKDEVILRYMVQSRKELCCLYVVKLLKYDCNPTEVL